jgi:uncharacterized protein (DUF58 family)
MNYKDLRQIFSLRDLRNAFLGLAVVLGGIALALVTIYARQTNNPRLAGIAALTSLVFVVIIIFFIVPPLARSASAEASQLNLPFEFTTGGAIFFGLLVVVGFAAWNTGNNLLFLVLAFLVSALVVSFFFGNFALKKLDVKMRFPDRVFAGEPTPILVSLHNRKRIFPTFSVVVEVRGRQRERSLVADDLEKILPKFFAEKLARPPLVRRTLDYFLNVPRRQSVENRVEHVFERRGRFIIKDFELSTGFPFAFFRHRRRLPAQEVEIVIYPRISPLEEELDDLPLEIGKFVVAKKGAGQDLLSLRDYQPNDDFRSVDWKATARSNRLIVREFAAEDEKRITVVFDPRITKTEKEKRKTLRQRIEEEQKGGKLSGSAKRFEKGASQAASLLSHFTEERAEIRLMIANERGDFQSGVSHLYDNLKRLAAIEPVYSENITFDDLSDDLERLLEDRNNSHIFLITTLKENDIPGEIRQRVKLVRY